MANFITLTPLTSANTNSYGITFTILADSAEIELVQMPSIILNKEITGIELVSINDAGLILKKNTLNAIIPWSNIINLKY